MKTPDRRAVGAPPGPYHVQPASRTAGWGICVGNGHEIVARIPGRDKAGVQAIARLLAAAPELLAEVERHHRELATALDLMPCVRAHAEEGEEGCLHCTLAADFDRIMRLRARIAGA
jgi:hypothetical protein